MSKIFLKFFSIKQQKKLSQSHVISLRISMNIKSFVTNLVLSPIISNLNRIIQPNCSISINTVIAHSSSHQSSRPIHITHLQQRLVCDLWAQPKKKTSHLVNTTDSTRSTFQLNWIDLALFEVISSATFRVYCVNICTSGVCLCVRVSLYSSLKEICVFVSGFHRGIVCDQFDVNEGFARVIGAVHRLVTIWPSK